MPDLPGVDDGSEPTDSSTPKRITFVLWDAESDGVAVKHDGEVVWRERTFDSLDQYVKYAAPLGVPVVIEWEVNDG